MSRYCKINAPERCEDIFYIHFADKTDKDYWDVYTSNDPEDQEIMKQICTLCMENLVSIK